VKGLGLADCVFLVIGNMVGTGIFLTTGEVAKSLPSPWWILLAWLLGGLMALCGALCYAELGAAFPRAGGHYVYLREAYGPLVGFLDGWLSFLASFPCSIAFMAIGLAEYLRPFVPGLSADHVLASLQVFGFGLTLHGGHVTALVVVVALSAINCLGVRPGSVAQNLLTALKIGCLVGLVGGGLFSGAGLWSHFALAMPAKPLGSTITALGTALIGVSFAYYGWDAATYVAGEVKKPERNLPLSLALGTLVVVALYLAFNFVLLYALPVEEMAGAPNVASDAAARLVGGAAPGLISAVIIVCILGSLNATILVGPRLYYAMARDGLFFRRMARLDPRSRVPTGAILAQAAWTCLILITGTFGQILTYCVFVMLILSAATAAAVFVLRVRRPDLERPYRVWGYPVVPAIFCLSALGIVVNTALTQPKESAWGLLSIGIGVFAYLYWRRKASIPQKPPSLSPSAGV
jgi:APA family basic amino acid/polyamine antiporter